MERGPLPLRIHAAIEPVIGIVLIAAPWIFGFSHTDDAKVLCIVLGIGYSDSGGATRFSIIAGVLEAVAALSTRWDPAEAAPEHLDRRRSATTSSGHRV